MTILSRIHRWSLCKPQKPSRVVKLRLAKGRAKGSSVKLVGPRVKSTGNLGKKVNANGEANGLQDPLFQGTMELQQKRRSDLQSANVSCCWGSVVQDIAACRCE